MNEQEAFAYLGSLNRFGIKPGLERIEYLLRELGNPHRKLRVIHVTGTNGKGSTVAMVSSMLKAGGYRVGTYISPHLQRFGERITVNGEEITGQEVARLVTRLKPLVDRMLSEGLPHPTEFEVVTALAFLYFYEQQVDFLVCEVGLGGSLDSTNVVQPMVAVVTNVTLEHTDKCGKTVSEIALHKAGIIKKGCMAVTAAQNPEALNVIEAACAQQRVKLYRVGKEITYQKASASLMGQAFRVQVNEQVFDHLWISLLGEHQLVNAAVAVGVMVALKEQGVGIPSQAIEQGLRQTRWPGRIEIVQTAPQVVLDGAHNPDGARVLRQALETLFTYEKLILVMGILGDKDYGQMIEMLAPLAHTVVVTRVPSDRAADPGLLAEQVGKYTPRVIVEPDVARAVKHGLAIAGEKDLVCVCGSLYLIGRVREMFDTTCSCGKDSHQRRCK